MMFDDIVIYKRNKNVIYQIRQEKYLFLFVYNLDYNKEFI